MLYISGPVFLKERLLYFLNKLFVKQVKSFHLLLDQNPFISLCSLHNIKYKSILCLFYHPALPQFVSFLNNLVQSRSCMSLF